METYAFRMFLNPGCRAEYRRRHIEIWPELVAALREAGVSDYSIFLDEEHDVLFAILKRRADHTMAALSQLPVMRRWWDSMAPLMRTHPDGEPVAEPLALMFHLD